MGDSMFGRLRRRARWAIAVVAIVLGTLTGIAKPAHAAFVSCDPLNPACLIAPVDDTYTTNFNQKLTVSAANGVLANDSGPTGSNVDVADSDTTSWNGANVTLHADGSFVYTPDPTNPYSGIDTFDYMLQDTPNNADGNADLATVTINVKAIVGNDAYTTHYNQVLNVGAPGVLANDKGVDPTFLTGDSASAAGAVVNLNGDGSFSYVPKHNFHGVDTFKYTVDDIDFDFQYTATVSITVLSPPPPPPPPTVKPKGYWMVGSGGTVYPFGQVRSYGNAPSAGIVHLEPTPSKRGYWVINSSGGVYAFGDAKSFGSAANLRRGESVSSLSATPSGKGYWIFTNQGKVFARGDARFFGDMHKVVLNGPVVGSVATTTGKGYYMVGSDGAVFSFGDAKFRGSMGAAHLNQPVNGIVPTSTSRGYWLVASDGGIFAFGDAGFRGSMGGAHLNRPVIGMVRYGNGYLMVSSDGGIFAFSNLPFLGSLGSTVVPAPIVGVAAGG